MWYINRHSRSILEGAFNDRDGIRLSFSSPAPKKVVNTPDCFARRTGHALTGVISRTFTKPMRLKPATVRTFNWGLDGRFQTLSRPCGLTVVLRGGQPLRSRRRPSTLPQVPGSGSRDPPSAPSLENHEACLATVETLEQEIEALEKDKETLSERLRGVESEKQKLVNDQHRWRQQLSERQETQQLVLEMQHTVTDWHQRLWSPAGLPENADPAGLRTALPATTAAPDMWTTQEDGGGAFDNDHDIAPGSGDFTQLLQF
ncbi:hypothetical protein CBS147353_10526 [Aspergillus niger]|nr:hypothetical protein CBS147353_10526 [Aspergillus niger]